MSGSASWRAGVAVAVGLSMASSATAQSLAEVAQQEEARRQSMASPSRVYTNADFSARAPGQAETTTSRQESRLAAGAELPVAPSAETRAPAPAPATTLRPTPIAARAVADPIPDPSPLLLLQRTATGMAGPRSLPAGWSTFVVPKTPDELADTARLELTGQAPPRAEAGDNKQPPQRDAVRLSTGLAYLQGADWGSQITGFGKLFGLRTDANAFLTIGPQGLQTRSGRIAVLDPRTGWGADAGDLHSDLRGLSRGVRASWRGAGDRRPAVSVYFQDSRRADANTVVTYRDSINLLSRFAVNGEAATSGEAFLRGRYIHPRLDLDAFYRYRPESSGGGRDKGVSASLNVWRGVGVSGGVQLSDGTSDASRWRFVSVRAPIAKDTNVTVERTWWNTATGASSTNALVLQLPVGPVRVMQRVQWGESAYLAQGLPVGFDQRQLQSTAAYSAGRWATFNFQASTQWFQDGRAQQWDELVSTARLGQGAQLQLVTAVPDFKDARRLRARFTQPLRGSFSLQVEYGRLSAFQQTPTFNGERSRLLVMVRKGWDVESPARGSDVAGKVVDQAGVPVSDAVVRLGPYRTLTDRGGRYRFSRVPDGQFDLTLDKEKLPATYAWDEAPQHLTVRGDTHADVDFKVVPLNAIRGRVYRDLNGNGRFDAGEGIPEAVVWLDDTATATDAGGAYGFYNQAPGPYRLRLDASRLPQGLAPLSAAERDVELPADGPLLGVDFTVQQVDKPILMRAMARR